MSASLTRDQQFHPDIDPSLRAGEIPSAAAPEKLAYRIPTEPETEAAVVDFVPTPPQDAPNYYPEIAEQTAEDLRAYFQEIENAGTLVNVRHRVLSDHNRES